MNPIKHGATDQSTTVRFVDITTGEPETAAEMRRTLAETGETADPHTAVALAALRRHPGPGPSVVLATAHPAKFPEAVLAATGQAPATPARAQALAGLPERFERIAADAGKVSAYVRSFAGG